MFLKVTCVIHLFGSVVCCSMCALSFIYTERFRRYLDSFSSRALWMVLLGMLVYVFHVGFIFHFCFFEPASHYGFHIGLKLTEIQIGLEFIVVLLPQLFKY